MQDKFVVAMVRRRREELPSWVVARLESVPGLEMRYGKCESEEELLALAGDADMIWTMAVTKALTPAVLHKLTRCKAIFRSGSGMDGYPVEEATKLGIRMCNCPESISESVAEQAVSLLFAMARQIPFADKEMRGMTGPDAKAHYNWHISGRTLGLVGFGRIGRRVAEMMAGFRTKILCYDPFAKPEAMAAAGVEPCPLDELLARADYVSLHCPLTETTRHLIGARELKLMKSNAILVNTSRGGVVDEPALVEALRNGVIGGAALDVTDPEPPAPDSVLFTLPNLILTPHMAAFSADFEKNFYECSITVILECMQGNYSHSMNLR